MALQLAEDRQLLHFQSYEEYLDSFVTPMDLWCLQNTAGTRLVAELGYRSSGDTLSKKEFNKRYKVVYEQLFPTRKPAQMASENIAITDNLLLQLAKRERFNRIGLLATIIFLRTYTKAGHEMSGYIDYGDRLQKDDWGPIFKGINKIWPRKTDLGFYNWKIGTNSCNSSLNFKMITTPGNGLVFQNINDHKIVYVDPSMNMPGTNTTRVRIYSDHYNIVILYDHVVRRKN